MDENPTLIPKGAVRLARTLVTGMSGTGKSTLAEALARQGYQVIDTDYGGWSHWVDLRTGRPAAAGDRGDYPWDELDWMWNEERMSALLNRETEGDLFVFGCAPNQGKFYGRFDHIVLLSAPVPVILDRLATRTNNTYGTTPRTRARVLSDIESIEPLLRSRATHEIDVDRPLPEVVESLLAVVRR